MQSTAEDNSSEIETGNENFLKFASVSDNDRIFSLKGIEIIFPREDQLEIHGQIKI